MSKPYEYMELHSFMENILPPEEEKVEVIEEDTNLNPFRNKKKKPTPQQNVMDVFMPEESTASESENEGDMGY